MDIEKIREVGRKVIEIEAQSIQGLLDRIDQKFVEACKLLHQCQGRLVVMGVGKSGHIGKKLAATFASTGSPSFFIHPSEARHGDIGMLANNDVLLVLSYSGESEEVVSILPFLKRLNIPLIALTGKPHSSLAKAATIHLDVSVEKEACPLGLAPTSSTTATLAMGDALAMSLLDLRGFTQQDFALSHPGGTLGRRLLLLVDQIMHRDTDVPTVTWDASFKEALMEITQKKLGMTTVVNDSGTLVGVFTDGDVRRSFDRNADIHQTRMREIMTTQPKTIPHTMRAAEALAIMETHKITSLVVTNPEQQPVGVLHIHDILRAGVI